MRADVNKTDVVPCDVYKVCSHVSGDVHAKNTRKFTGQFMTSQEWMVWRADKES